MTPYTTVELEDFYQDNIMHYKFSKGLWKGFVQLVIFGWPLLLLSFPTWADLTIGTAGNLLVNFLKVKYGK